MTPQFSLYLDLVRVVAAFLVLWSHTNLRVLSADVPAGSQFGHTAVIVFFVLSGYVISLTASRRDADLREYAVHRIARIYSVALPALLLMPILDVIGSRLRPEVYQGQAAMDMWWLRITASLALLNESWTLSIQPFSNAPFWSIAYEGWYYILFGIAVYVRRSRFVWLSIAALICGPKILLLLPIWLMGVALHRWESRTRLTARGSAALLLASTASWVAFQQWSLDARLRDVVGGWVGKELQLDYMTYSGGFLADALLGVIITLNFAAVRGLPPLPAAFLRSVTGPIRFVAGFTLSLYLFHRPLLLFFIAVLRGDPTKSTFFVETIACVLIAIIVLGLVTERQRHGARRLAARLVDSIEAVWSRGSQQAGAAVPGR